MKKTLLSVLAGIAVIGSASAVPSPADRKTACEQQPDKVWVEKTQACIPVIPCLSDDETIKKTYCVDDFSNTGEKLVRVVEMYTRNVLKTGVSSADVLAAAANGDFYLAVKTTDGNYFVAEAGSSFSGVDGSIFNDVADAFKAYGLSKVLTAEDIEKNHHIECWSHRDAPALTESDCEVVAAFASELSGVSFSVSYDADKKKCDLTY